MHPSCLDMDRSILAEILDAAMEIGEADCGDIRLVDGRTGILDFVVQRGFSGEWERYWRSKPLKFSICEMALDKKQLYTYDIPLTVTAFEAGLRRL
jgi:hypothetical protein